jgi:hypothetical protein
MYMDPKQGIIRLIIVARCFGPSHAARVLDACNMCFPCDGYD